MVGKNSTVPPQGNQIFRTPVHSLRSGLQYQGVSLNITNQRLAVSENDLRNNENNHVENLPRSSSVHVPSQNEMSLIDFPNEP